MSRRDGLRRSSLAVLMLLTCGFGPQDESRKIEHVLECEHCHECAQPSADEPCLKQYACPRHLASTELATELGPDVVILDQLVDLYVPVRFAHRMHAEMAEMSGGCATCHHYTPPNFPHPACRECHAAGEESEDLAQPGLKGAYHRQCLDCHVEWDRQTECEVCHEKRAGGGLGGTATTYCTTHHHDPVTMEDVIVFETEYEEGDRVPFHHRNHVEMYGADCALCHRQQSCAQCHVHATPLHPMGDPGHVDLHETCYQCHDENRCEHCHGRAEDDLFDHAATGWPLRTYHASLHCDSCHGWRGGKLECPEPDCETCHADRWASRRFDHAVTGVVLDEVHGEADCGDCHQAGIGKGARCDACHDDDRNYSPHASFGPGAGR